MDHKAVLPKNIRQIGEIQKEERMYLEDYVMTFLRKKAREMQGETRGGCAGILMGEYGSEECEGSIFVKGALLLGEQAGEDGGWEALEEEGRQYFPEEEAVGYFIVGTLDEEPLKQMMERFSGTQFLLFHAQEGEEHLYLARENEYRRLKGYLIYYESNPQMQKYMTDHCQKRQVEKEEGNSDAAMKNFREKVEKKTHRPVFSGMRYVTGSVAALAFLVLGITIIHNYDKMKEIEAVIADISAQQQKQRMEAVLYAEKEMEQKREADDGASPESKDGASDTGGNAAEEGEDNKAAAASSGQVLNGEKAGLLPDAGSGETLTVSAGGQSTGEDTALKENQTPGESMALTESTVPDETTTVSSIPGTLEGTETTSAGISSADSGITAQGESAAAQFSVSEEGKESLEVSAQGLLEGLPEELLAEESRSARGLAERSYSAENPDTAAGTTQEVSANGARAVYTIKYGDTLADISVKYYGTLDKVAEICSINNIDDANLIVPGEKIVLP